MKNKELSLIQKIRRLADKHGRRGVRRPLADIGDDAAIVPVLSPSQELLITTDLVIEGSHFRPDLHPAGALGHKVLARGLSDIAAMGGTPAYALLSLCLPPWAGPGWQNQFLAGLFRLARRCGVRLVGGDLAAGKQFAADIVLLGWARKGRALRRNAAKPGDVLYVSGQLGGSALGLERQLARRSSRDAAIRRHLYPDPRLALGRYLARNLGVRAAMDLSDGLSIDLFRLAKESRVGAKVRLSDVPVFPGASTEQALHGGEDYELLFTAPPKLRVPPSFQGIPLTAIGVITSGHGINLPVRGFQHAV